MGMVDFHPKELKETGLCPSDFELINCQMSVSIAREKGFHPDDQHRECKIKFREPEKQSLNILE